MWQLILAYWNFIPYLTLLLILFVMSILEGSGDSQWNQQVTYPDLEGEQQHAGNPHPTSGLAGKMTNDAGNYFAATPFLLRPPASSSCLTIPPLPPATSPRLR